MAETVLHRISGADGAVVCEELFVEYLSWVLQQWRDLNGIETSAEEEAEVHEGFRTEYPALLGPRGRLVLATVDGEPAGVAALKPLTGTASELKRVYVRPAHRGKGVSRLLLSYLIEQAREIGFLTMQLDSGHYMKEAHALYRSVGFVEVPPHPSEAMHYGLEDLTLFMRLELS